MPFRAPALMDMCVNTKTNSLPILAWIVAVVALDQATKRLIMASFDMFEVLEIIPSFFNLIYVTNTGAAFGFLAGEQALWRQLFFVGVALFALAVLFFTYRHYRSHGRLYTHAIGLIAGGALGNLIDRLLYGAVVDFLDFYVGDLHWPAFNVADSAITIGVGLFLMASMKHPQSQ